jgi:hypothetical protein
LEDAGELTLHFGEGDEHFLLACGCGVADAGEEIGNRISHGSVESDASV